MAHTTPAPAETGAVDKSPARPLSGKRQASRVRRQRLRAAWLFLIPMLVVLAAVAG